MSYHRISDRALKTLALVFPDADGLAPDLAMAVREIHALRKRKPLREAVKASRQKKALKREEKRENFSTFRKMLESRAAGRCENCGRSFTDFEPSEADHFFGRGRVPETLGTVWMLDRHCHRQKTDNYPSAAYWLRAFLAHCERYEHKPWIRTPHRLATRRLEAIELSVASEEAARGAR